MESLREIIRALRAKKSLGQNFLSDPQILKRIVDAAFPLEGRTVIEVGSGPGGLTREIIRHPCLELFLIEKDERCLPYLEELKRAFKGHLTLLNEDALKTPLHELGSPPRKIIGNLPYNVSVPLLVQWLKNIDDFESLTLMFQKEVASRILAKPSTSDYGRLSILCQWASNVQKVFDLPPGAFSPPPKVTSTVLQFTPRVPREDISLKALERITMAAFTQRRKMLRSSLKTLVDDPCPLLERCQINPERRAETLSVQEFCCLAKEWERIE